jgi:hypothetical protein
MSFVANSIVFHAQKMMLISAPHPMREYTTRLILHFDLLPVNFSASRLQIHFHHPGLGDSSTCQCLITTRLLV